MVLIGVLGFGEVGMAISRLYSLSDLKINDPAKGFQDSLSNLAILNVCIPWSNTFIDQITNILLCNMPQLCIIHSTVKPGTIQKIKAMVPNMFIVHSPIRGIRPNLYESLFTFTKYIGAETDREIEAASNHLQSLGIVTYGIKPAKSTEVLELLDTSQYAFEHALIQEMRDICRKYGVSFNTIVNHANKTYNEGCQRFNPAPEYIKPLGIAENLETLLTDFPDKPGLLFIKKYLDSI